jgi:hypothetical protein
VVPLLQEELEICGPDAKIVAVGKVVDEFLTQQGFPKLFTRVIHYSGQAVSARKKAIEDHEDSFADFKNSVSLQDVFDAAEDFLRGTHVAVEFQKDILSRLEARREKWSRLGKSQPTVSQQQLIFHYKLKFESMRS